MPYSAMLNVKEIIATPINSNRFTDFESKKFDLKNLNPKIPTLRIFRCALAPVN